MKKALICGVSGQDGSYLAKLLVAKGYSVFGTSRDSQNSSFSNLKKLGILDSVKTCSMALNDFRSVLQVLKDVKPDEVYNLSGQSSVGLSFEQPVETMETISLGTLNMIEAIRFLSKNIRFYNAGSSECCGETTADNPADENTSFHPKSPYAVAKSAAHWQVATYREAYGLFACTGILFNHESCLRPERFVTRKIVETARRIANGSTEKLVLGNTKVIRDWGWSPEYVEAMWRILQHDMPDDFVVATGKSTSLERFVELAFAEFGLDWQKYLEIRPELFRPLDLEQSHANPAKAMKILGWQAKHMVEDVVRFMAAEIL
jgi:GDPmannose 4,6-dehydratase